MDHDYLFKSEDMTDKTIASEPLGHVFHRLLLLPLYQKITITEPDPSGCVKALRFYICKFDRYCPACNKTSTWERVISTNDKRRSDQEALITAPLSSGRFPVKTSWVEDFTIKIACTRNKKHIATFYFAIGVNNEIIKVGQYPSLTDFQKGDIDHLDEGFTKEQKSDFIKAINTMAHGFNVAACVYLRRVFESVLNETKIAHMQSQKRDKWEEFDRADANQRIKLLKDDLPEFMSANPKIYHLLSKGIHELTEDECEKELPILKKSIEVIISDRIEQLRAKKNRDELTKMISQRVDHHENK
jgi:hypothetical protein